MNYFSWIKTQSLKAIYAFIRFNVEETFPGSCEAFGDLRLQAALRWAAIVCRSKVRSEAPESLRQRGTSSRGHRWRSVGQREHFLDGVISHTCVHRFKKVEEARKPTQRVGIGPKP